MNKNDFFWLQVLVVSACIVGFIAFWAIASSFEAAAFNRVTGKNVSTWDAMWVELRVQDSAGGD